MDSPSDCPPCHPHPSYLLHGAVVAAATSVAGHSAYAGLAEITIAALEDQASYLGAIDPNRLGYKHCFRVVAGDVEACPAAARDSAL